MPETNYLPPNINDGRFFISPILGCSAGCSYCYLEIKDYTYPRKNEVSLDECKSFAYENPQFVWGKDGTIISVGAWGDIFPLNKDDLIQYSISFIKELLSWGNPVQIMSKNHLAEEYVKEIVYSVQYPRQLLYSTTITTINTWKEIEPKSSDPVERLQTCQAFHVNGIPTNVLLKPFILGLTGQEIEAIAKLLLEYQIDFCTLGVMYWNDKISKKALRNPLLSEILKSDIFSLPNHLDCNGDTLIASTQITALIPFVEYLRKNGIAAFLKSSCVNANILGTYNLSDYYKDNSQYCINCGNCDSKVN